MIAERPAQLAEATDSAIALLRSERRIEGVAQAVLERLATAVRCEWGAYWALDPPTQRLQAVASWSALGPKGERLEQDARVHPCHRGHRGPVEFAGPFWNAAIA